MDKKQLRKIDDVWQITRINGEFAKGFDTFNELDKPCISVFGSARTRPTDEWYLEAEKVGKLLSEAGFGVITGGGPGIMEDIDTLSSTHILQTPI